MKVPYFHIAVEELGHHPILAIYLDGVRGLRVVCAFCNTLVLNFLKVLCMTIINGIEIDVKPCEPDSTRTALLNNDPLDTHLHVIAVVSNPCMFARRYILAREFISRMEREANVILYVVELAYGDQGYYVTQPNNPRHLRLKGEVPLWHKENMINIGTKLLPPTWKAMAWIDADIEFEHAHWACDALKVLNGHRDVIQLFSHAVDMDKDLNAMNIFPSFGFQYCKNSSYGVGMNMWHPGYAWACTRRAYDRMGGLYAESILGSGDHNMSFAFVGQSEKSLNCNVSQGYKDSIAQFQQRAVNLRLGYVPGVIRHYFHGQKKNRKYNERWQILLDNQFDPLAHITKNKDGLLVPTPDCPPQLLKSIMEYFLERNEDEFFTV